MSSLHLKRIHNSYNIFSLTEFLKLNAQLDEINNALDSVEERTDSINGKLRQILLENQMAKTELESLEKEENGEK